MRALTLWGLAFDFVRANLITIDGDRKSGRFDLAISQDALIFFGGTQIWLMKLLALFFGYKIVLVGSSLLRDGISGEFKFQSEFQGFKADLASVSPGLFFVLIGGIIIVYAFSIERGVKYPTRLEVIEESSSVESKVQDETPPPEVDLSGITRESSQ